MAHKSFVAHYQGNVVGTRTSAHRTYTHAIVVVDVKGTRRDEWCSPQRDTRENRHSFDYHRSIVDGTYKLMAYVKPEDKLRSELIVSAGYEAFLRHLTEQNIASYERWQEGLKTEPYVYGWSMSERNAQKTARSVTSPTRKLVAIVPAELVVPRFQGHRDQLPDATAG